MKKARAKSERQRVAELSLEYLLQSQGADPRPGTPEYRKKFFEILRVGRGLGMSFARQTDSNDSRWDGRTLNVDPERLSETIHEIAHFCVSAPEMRRRMEFGLGGTTSWQPCPVVISETRDTDKVEYLASLFGILLERRLGIDALHTLDDHGWSVAHGRITSSADRAKTLNVLGQLHDLGLLDPYGAPRHVVTSRSLPWMV